MKITARSALATSPRSTPTVSSVFRPVSPHLAGFPRAVAPWAIGIWLSLCGLAGAQHSLVTHHVPDSMVPPAECPGGLDEFLARRCDEPRWDVRASPTAVCVDVDSWIPWHVERLTPDSTADTCDAVAEVEPSPCAARHCQLFAVLPVLWWDGEASAYRTSRFSPFVAGAAPPTVQPPTLVDFCSDERQAVRDIPAHLPSAQTNDGPPTFSDRRSADDHGMIPEAWGPDVISAAGNGYQITMTTGRRGAGAPQGTMYLWRLDPTLDRGGPTLRNAPQSPTAGVVLTRPPGDYSLDWVGVAVSGAIYRR